MYLFWALVLTRVWMNIWLLQLLVPLLGLMWIFKAFGMYKFTFLLLLFRNNKYFWISLHWHFMQCINFICYEIYKQYFETLCVFDNSCTFYCVVHQLKPGGFFGEKVEYCKSSFMEWYTARSEVLAPRWVIGLLKLFSRGDAKVDQHSLYWVLQFHLILSLLSLNAKSNFCPWCVECFPCML